MRFLLFILLFMGCVEENTVSEFADKSDCGVSPYILNDSPYSEGNHLYVKVRAIKIVKTGGKKLNEVAAISTLRRLNIDYKKMDISFRLEEVITIEDDKAYNEGMNFYQKHASKYQEIGFINIFYYENSSDVTFGGAAVAIPSISFCVKERYSSASTASHEMGHCLGLYHTHTYSRPGKDDYKTGDFVCGTKYAKIPYSTNDYGYIGEVTDDCRYIGKLGNLTQSDHDMNVRNIMSYSVPKCRDYFTEDQGDRVRFIINNSQDHKKAITTSKN